MIYFLKIGKLFSTTYLPTPYLTLHPSSPWCFSHLQTPHPDRTLDKYEKNESRNKIKNDRAMFGTNTLPDLHENNGHIHRTPFVTFNIRESEWSHIICDQNSNLFHQQHVG